MKATEHYLLDVFTDKPFSGNQLAVFLNADELETSTMQAIANELNLAETVFLGAATKANHYPMRIFTPTQELPFAGHPTVGTAHLLAGLHLVNPEQTLVLQPPIGELHVRYIDGKATFTTAMPASVTGSTIDRLTAVELLGLDIHQVIADPVMASCGLPFHLIELADLAALEHIQIAGAVWADAVTTSGTEQIYLYVVEQRDSEETIVRSRMFSMHASLCEDPATGSAAAALTGFLASTQPTTLRWKIHQGVEMGRPSVIHTAANGNIEPGLVQVGGDATIVGRGEFYLEQ
ncbi:MULTISPECIES: PhzF family phenazine biosynthesis protein [Vreelandella]|uniref:PhzF family phenazine biosynthesis protein n=2 Tax=Vreelandella TaxID=3137766 RepID=A0A7C9JRF8_9GAMM|nr:MULTISPECIES: PhzF family phenazine biosynthesis protein [Halomonas]NDL69183.1 PhzF family phenazine biosynthesis protein [Halomonas alkaliphila]NYS44121.1 PhzF family phenazine biosynthesis protein [Halomonas zhaodongensis]